MSDFETTTSSRRDRCGLATNRRCYTKAPSRCVQRFVRPLLFRWLGIHVIHGGVMIEKRSRKSCSWLSAREAFLVAIHTWMPTLHEWLLKPAEPCATREWLQDSGSKGCLPDRLPSLPQCSAELHQRLQSAKSGSLPELQALQPLDQEETECASELSDAAQCPEAVHQGASKLHEAQRSNRL